MLGGLSQDISIVLGSGNIWIWTFLMVYSHTWRLHVSIWVIFNQMIKSTYSIIVKISYLMKNYAKLYIKEIGRFPKVPFSIISDCPTLFTYWFYKYFQKSVGTRVKLGTPIICKMMGNRTMLSKPWNICWELV